MKPRYRPGKPATEGRVARIRTLKSKALTETQMEHLKNEASVDAESPKTGRGGERAHWVTNYEEGCLFDQKPIPYKDSESISQDGIRKFRKNSR